MTLMRTSQVNPAEKPFAMFSGTQGEVPGPKKKNWGTVPVETSGQHYWWRHQSTKRHLGGRRSRWGTVPDSTSGQLWLACWLCLRGTWQPCPAPPLSMRRLKRVVKRVLTLRRWPRKMRSLRSRRRCPFVGGDVTPETRMKRGPVFRPPITLP